MQVFLKLAPPEDAAVHGGVLHQAQASHWYVCSGSIQTYLSVCILYVHFTIYTYAGFQTVSSGESSRIRRTTRTSLR